MADVPRSLHFNGINASNGEYLFPSTDAAQFAEYLAAATPQGDSEAAPHVDELRARRRARNTTHLGAKSGIDLRDLSQTGWAAVMPAAEPGSSQAKWQAAVLDALAPLLELRRRQAARLDERLFRIYRGPSEGYQRGENKRQYLARLGAGPGSVEPLNVPYYLLLLGDPDEIPYSVQYQLDVQYAVGRLHFDSIEEYACYARSVVVAESGNASVKRDLAMFAVANPDDPATDLSARLLVAPLVDRIATITPEWIIRHYRGEHATKADLARLLGGDSTPAVLFTASHGIGFDRGDTRQRRHQGALLCQDWPGPVAWKQREIPCKHYFAGEDVTDAARLHGLIMISFACYSAGTPMFDEYAHRSRSSPRTPLTHAPFVAALPQRLLSHPAGGALATIGHVGRAWGTSFLGLDTDGEQSLQLVAFESTLREILDGAPVGAALEYFNQRYADLATDLADELEEIDDGRRYDPAELASLWTATHDARGYGIIGDPAVRLPQPASEVRTGAE